MDPHGPWKVKWLSKPILPLASQTRSKKSSWMKIKNECNNTVSLEMVKSLSKDERVTANKWLVPNNLLKKVHTYLEVEE